MSDQSCIFFLTSYFSNPSYLCMNTQNLFVEIIKFRLTYQQQPFFCLYPTCCPPSFLPVSVILDLPYSANDALNVLPGFIPIFSVLKSQDPALILSLMQAALSIKTCSTPDPVLALVSKQSRLFLCANACPSSVLTYLSNLRSALLATSNIIIFEYALSLISSSHLTRLSKVYLRVISQQRRAQMLPRQ